MNESILVYRRLLFLKLALVVAAASILAYGLHQPLGMPSGGTWLGYVLGSLGALLILWLMWFGIRKRSYGPGRVKLEAWLSAHVYLGLALLVVGTLHTGFQFGWNVHTLAYGLMLAVIASGVFGLYAYIRYPRLMTENRRGVTLQAMLAQIAEIDRECREIAIGLGEDVNRTIMEAAAATRVGGGAMRQLSGRDPNCPNAAALRRVEQLAGSDAGNNAAYRRLVALLARKDELLRRARRDVQFAALMQVWLFLHVPLSFALLATLAIHVFAVFFYW